MSLYARGGPPFSKSHYKNLTHATMYKKLNDLQFVIGLFFTVVSLILLGSVLMNDGETVKVNIYTGVAFLIFGLCMIFIRSRKPE